MTEASTGLSRALARAGTGVVTIAEMQTDDLLAAMSDDQKADLAAKIAPEKPETPNDNASADDNAATPKPGKDGEDGDGEDGDEDESEAGDGKKKDKMSETSADAHARVKAVAKAVAEDDSCKGKADMALQMLADDDYAGLPASGIVKILGKTTAGSTAGADPEAAARAEMQNAISASKNSNIDPSNSGGSGGGGQSAGDLAWGNVLGRMNKKG